jgi:hypothetical protein
MFAVNQIDHAELVTLEEEDLLEMGMRRDDNRALLLSAVRALRAASTSPPTPRTPVPRPPDRPPDTHPA